MTEQSENRWHLDKKVQLPVVLAIFAQTIGLAAWAASLASRVEDHERRLVRAESAAELRIARDMQTEGRLARIEEGIRALLDTAQRLERRVDQSRGEGR